MTDRDHFAAAALTGLLYPEVDDEFAMPYIVGRAYLWADAMLRERERTNLDAAPAATADSPDERPPHAVSASGGTPSAASRDGSGTGDTAPPTDAK
jgi:hypothetical protein